MPLTVPQPIDFSSSSSAASDFWQLPDPAPCLQRQRRRLLKQRAKQQNPPAVAVAVASTAVDLLCCNCARTGATTCTGHCQPCSTCSSSDSSSEDDSFDPARRTRLHHRERKQWRDYRLYDLMPNHRRAIALESFDSSDARMYLSPASVSSSDDDSDSDSGQIARPVHNTSGGHCTQATQTETHRRRAPGGGAGATRPVRRRYSDASETAVTDEQPDEVQLQLAQDAEDRRQRRVDKQRELVALAHERLVEERRQLEARRLKEKKELAKMKRLPKHMQKKKHKQQQQKNRGQKGVQKGVPEPESEPVSADERDDDERRVEEMAAERETTAEQVEEEEQQQQQVVEEKVPPVLSKKEAAAEAIRHRVQCVLQLVAAHPPKYRRWVNQLVGLKLNGATEINAFCTQILQTICANSGKPAAIAEADDGPRQPRPPPQSTASHPPDAELLPEELEPTDGWLAAHTFARLLRTLVDQRPATRQPDKHLPAEIGGCGLGSEWQTALRWRREAAVPTSGGSGGGVDRATDTYDLFAMTGGRAGTSGRPWCIAGVPCRFHAVQVSVCVCGWDPLPVPGC